MRASFGLGSLSLTVLLATGALLGACSSTVDDARTASGASATSSATTTTAGVGGGSTVGSTATAGVGGESSSTSGAGGTADIPYPAPHPSMPQIPNNGGAVLKAPVIITVTFPGDPLQDKEQQFDAEVGGLKWWSTVHDSYGVGPATSGGNVLIADAAPATMTASELETWLQDRITDGTLPAPTDQTIYALYFQSSTTVTFDPNQGGGSLCQEFLGYHSSINATTPTGLIPAAYAVIGQCGDIDNVTETASHEFTEAATDPHPIAGQPAYVYVKPSPWTTLGGEDGDMCAGVSSVVENGWSLTRVWNNPNAAEGNQPCVPVPDPVMGAPLPYFNAGIVTETLKANPGDTVSTEVDCYSFGPLPTDMTLVAQAFGKKTLQFSFDANQGGGSLCQEFLGYHSSITAQTPDGVVPAAYAVTGQCGDIDSVTETASHEFTEAATDPHPINGKPAFVYLKNSPWTTLGGEDGDMCSGVSGVVENGWALTRVWNNPNAAEGNQPCVPVPDPVNGQALPYFNAGIVHDTLKASPGETVSTEVDCYSFGPLPNDMQLVGQAFSKKNLTFSFDKDTCKNGDIVTMSITVSASAKSATDYHYSLLAQLDANTAHAWRGMVHVK